MCLIIDCFYNKNDKNKKVCHFYIDTYIKIKPFFGSPFNLINCLKLKRKYEVFQFIYNEWMERHECILYSYGQIVLN